MLPLLIDPVFVQRQSTSLQDPEDALTSVNAYWDRSSSAAAAAIDTARCKRYFLAHIISVISENTLQACGQDLAQSYKRYQAFLKRTANKGTYGKARRIP